MNPGRSDSEGGGWEPEGTSRSIQGKGDSGTLQKKHLELLLGHQLKAPELWPSILFSAPLACICALCTGSSDGSLQR